MNTFQKTAYEIIAILKAASAKLSELDKKHAEASAKAGQLGRVSATSHIRFPKKGE